MTHTLPLSCLYYICRTVNVLSIPEDTLNQRCYMSQAPGLPTSAALPVQLGNSGRPGLCLAEHGDLLIPRTRTTRLGRRSFFIAAPVVWNSLLLHLRSPSISRSQFQAGLKTHLFRPAFHWPFLWELIEEIELNCTELTKSQDNAITFFVHSFVHRTTQKVVDRLTWNFQGKATLSLFRNYGPNPPGNGSPNGGIFYRRLYLISILCQCNHS